MQCLNKAFWLAAASHVTSLNKSMLYFSIAYDIGSGITKALSYMTHCFMSPVFEYRFGCRKNEKEQSDKGRN